VWCEISITSNASCMHAVRNKKKVDLDHDQHQAKVGALSGWLVGWHILALCIGRHQTYCINNRCNWRQFYGVRIVSSSLHDFTNTHHPPPWFNGRIDRLEIRLFGWIFQGLR
jgi:hypothetical protein